MARILEIREVCERALRKIGSYSIRDSGADAAELQEARYWLDLVVGHVAAMRRMWWLVPDTATITLIDGQTDYELTALLPSGDPFAFPVSVTSIRTETDVRDPVCLWRRWEWEARDAAVVTGRPQAVYIDRDPEAPVMRVWPAPTAPIDWHLEMVFQRVTPDFTAGASSERIVRIREAWNLYLVTALAAQLGNGPVRKLPADEVRDMKQEAADLLMDIEKFDIHEHADEPRRVAFHDF